MPIGRWQLFVLFSKKYLAQRISTTKYTYNMPEVIVTQSAWGQYEEDYECELRIVAAEP